MVHRITDRPDNRSSIRRKRDTCQDKRITRHILDIVFVFSVPLDECLITGKHVTYILVKDRRRCRLDRDCGQCHIEITMFAITCFSYLHGLSFSVLSSVSKIDNDPRRPFT